MSSDPLEEKKEESYLDITSDTFDPLQLLQTNADYKILDKIIKVRYDNLASLENALKKYGLLQLCKSKKQSDEEPTTSKASLIQKEQLKAFEEIRNRLLCQTNPELKPPVVKTAKRHLRSLETQTTNVVGPLSLLEKCVKDQSNCCVKLRNSNSISGSVEGRLIYFDKYMNLLLVNVVEKRRRRKYGYGKNKTNGQPINCTHLLQKLGIQLPYTEVKSLDRKNVQITRHIKQLFVRGDQVAVISRKDKE